jgi:simple sugar transport system permease protein
MRWAFHYLRTSEGVIFMTTALLFVVVGLVNPAFLSAPNLLDLVRNSITTGLFALGVLIALISGGIDVSFTAIAAVAMYGTVKLFVQLDPQAPLILIFLVGALVGALLGAINGILIAFFRLPTLIVTLGTLSLFRGFLLTFLGTKHIVDLPNAMIDLSRTYLYRGRLADGSLFSLPATTLVLVGITVFVIVLLRFTAIGRFIYGLGGSEVASSRLGIPVARTKLFIYVFIGLIAGMTGIVHSSQARVANPFDLVGSELNVIAAVVLGGARITGGRGGVFGTFLGVSLVTIINNSLVLLNVSSLWDRCIVGALIILGAGVPLLLRRLQSLRTGHPS